MKQSLEELYETFCDHAEAVKKERKKALKIFKANNPGEEIPEHFYDEFNLAAALSVICEEILKLRKNSDT